MSVNVSPTVSPGPAVQPATADAIVRWLLDSPGPALLVLKAAGRWAPADPVGERT